MTKSFKPIDDERMGEYCSLLIFSSLGMMLMVSSNDLLMVFLSMEFVSLCCFVLAGFIRKDRKSLEGALKYFLIGAVSSGIFVYGVSLIAGITGSVNFFSIAKWVKVNGMTPLFAGSALMMLAGFGFKIAMVPFHMWAPDVYEGAPTTITAYLSVASKAAGIAVILRTFTAGMNIELNMVIAVISAATMTIGNLLAISQNNVKRMLAYSGIAHVGYMLMGFASGGDLGIESVVIYNLAYLFMNLGAFACVIAIFNIIGSDDINNYAGLSAKNPFLSLVFFLFLLSLAGIPPTAGFIAKFYVFSAAIDNGFIWLAVIGALNGVIALYYYMRITYNMYFKTGNTEAIKIPAELKFIIGFSAIMVLLFCIIPGTFISFTNQAVNIILK
jgi:NADH-quinone oxidoreductase subunit N